MGQILSQPVTEKHSESDASKHLAYGLSLMQGWRINMEDAHATILDFSDSGSSGNSTEKSAEETLVAFFGVYDGHGGDKVAIYTGKHLHDIIRGTEAFAKKDYIGALKQGFLTCDQNILRDEDMKDDDSGCAATSVIITKDSIICGNAGDSRTVMSVNGFAKALSFDHKPLNEGEKARICSAGGYVDMGRVNGNLALSRGIGDFEFKKNLDLPAEEQIVTCYPDVILHPLDLTADEFVILACDGIWDCLTSQHCVECVRRGIYERKPLTQISEEIMELCCAPTSDGLGIGCDNMSIVIVALLDASRNETLDEWYEKIIARVDANDSKYGPISSPYSEMYKQMYGEYFEIGQQGNQPSRGAGGAGGQNSMFGGLPGLSQFKPEEEEAEEADQQQDGEANGAISLQKLLASNAITNENGVIYLDTSSAQSLLAHFGMSEDQENDKIEEERESESDDKE